jgi:hypothetical protein
VSEKDSAARKPKKNGKDGWDKWRIILEPAGGLLTAAAVAFLTYFTSKSLTRWQERENTARARSQETENNARVYTELMSKREEAETGLRKAMFDSIMKAFLDSSTSSPSEPQKSLEDEILKIELLAYNFHESLNLAPLFKNLEREIDARLLKDPNDRVALHCRKRLRKVATDSVEKQLAALTTADGRNSAVLVHGSFQEPFNNKVPPADLYLGKTRYHIEVVITAQDAVTQESRVSLDVKTNDSAGPDQFPPRHAEFWVSSFDFPMIDNTRLPNDQFCALVLKILEPDENPTYELHAVCFPGSRALQEKPYYDEILERLRQDATH